MSDSEMTRRNLLAGALPAAAMMGAAWAGASQVMGQEAPRNARGARAAGDLPQVARYMMSIHRDGQYVLPELPYAYDALEPHIDTQTMELHHSRHHQAYVNGLNRALSTARELAGGEEIDGQKLTGVQRDISFNGGGHVLHSIFWATMGPRNGGAGGQPQGEIARALDRSFGSFGGFRRYFSSVAAGVKGSGWALLAYEPLGDNLIVLQFNDQDLRYIASAQPLMGIDVWEHAYYLKYQNRRAEYVEAWWNVVNWSAVNELYAHFQRVRQQTVEAVGFWPGHGPLTPMPPV
jgi:superoxide dismutase, Fe-Mn family